MKFNVLTLFPEMINNAMSESIIGRAITNELISVNAINIRDFSKNKHMKVDDYPYGGGAGMLMQVQPVVDAYNSIESVKNGKKQERNGPCRPDGRQGVGSEHPSDDHGVGQVIGLLKHVADEQRQRKDGQQDQWPSFRHVHGSGMSHEDVLLFRWSK